MFDKARTKGHVDLAMKRCEFEELSIFSFASLNSIILDDGHTKPAPREDGPPTGKAATTSQTSRSSSSSSSKARLDSTSSDGGPDFMCLIRANYRTEKISTVVRE